MSLEGYQELVVRDFAAGNRPPLGSGPEVPGYITPKTLEFTVPGGESVAPVTMFQILSGVDQLKSLGLSPDAFGRYVNDIIANPLAYGKTLDQAQTFVEKEQGQEAIDELADTAAADMESGLNNLLGPLTVSQVSGGEPVFGERTGGLKGEGLDFFDTQIGRLQGFLDRPSSLRSDAEMAGILSSFENGINAQLETTRKGAAKTLASSGLRAAGKISNPVRAAGQQAVAQKGMGIQNLLGQTQQRLGGLKQARLGFLGDIDAAERDIRAGGLGNLTQLEAMIQGLQSPSFFSPQATEFDIRGLGLAENQFNTGALISFLQPLISGGMNTIRDFGTGLTKHLPGGE